MIRILTASLIMVAASVFSAQAADIAAGKKAFNKCKACHMVGAKAKNRVGPTLNGIVGRAWGTVEGFKYSKGKDGTLLQILESDDTKVWDIPTLTAYLTKPKDVIPKGKMVFAGFKKAEDIDNVIAYLASFDADGNEIDPAPVLEAAAGE